MPTKRQSPRSRSLQIVCDDRTKSWLVDRRRLLDTFRVDLAPANREVRRRHDRMTTGRRGDHWSADSEVKVRRVASKLIRRVKLYGDLAGETPGNRGMNYPASNQRDGQQAMKDKPQSKPQLQCMLVIDIVASTDQCGEPANRGSSV